MPPKKKNNQLGRALVRRAEQDRRKKRQAE
jgi:hypothetical protein